MTDFTRSVEDIEGRLLYTVRGSALEPDNSRALCSTQRTCDYVHRPGLTVITGRKTLYSPKNYCYGKE